MVGFGCRRDRLPIRDGWGSGQNRNSVIPLKSLPNNFQVQLTHPRDNRLSGLRVRKSPESRIFIAQDGQCGAEPVPVLVEAWLQGQAHNRFREHRPFQLQWSRWITSRIARAESFETNCSQYVARMSFNDILTALREKTQQTSDPCLSPGAGVQDAVAFLQHTGIRSQEHHTPALLVMNNLEDERSSRLRSGYRDGTFLTIQMRRNRTHISRAR